MADSFRGVKREKIGLSAAIEEVDGVLWITSRDDVAVLGWVPGKRSSERGARDFWLDRREIRRVRIGRGRRPGACKLDVETRSGEVVIYTYPQDRVTGALDACGLLNP